MFRIIENPETKVLYMESQSQIHSFNGTPYTKPDTTGWRVIGEVACLFDWQQEPGRNALAMVVELYDPKTDTRFVAGGSSAYITASAKERGMVIAPTAEAYDNRNAARPEAHRRGGVMC